jgi:REP element-mobilizing transposase RayT
MLRQRKQIRLKKYDYSQSGYYYVTICTQNRECLFGNITNHPVGVGRDRPQTFGRDRPIMVLNQYGKIIKNVWESLPHHHPVILDEFQIMPNHIHFILRIVLGASRTNNVLGASRRAPTIQTMRTLGFIVGIFKTECTAQINRLRNTPGQKLFQRNYYEHIIRNEIELNRIRKYIKNNV